MLRLAFSLATLSIGLTTFDLPSIAGNPTLTDTPAGQLSSSDSEISDYILGAGDRVRITVRQAEKLGGDFLILPDGTLTLPLIGRIKVDRMTVSRAGEILTQRYAVYIRDPSVTLSVTLPRPVQIAVVGEVNNPGTYTIPLEKMGNIPLLTELLRLAGGVTTVADIGQIQIRRNINGQDRTLQANLWDLLQKGDRSQDVGLRDGDSILVPTKTALNIDETRQLADANFGILPRRDLNVTVVGEVYRPGSYRIVPGQNTNGSGATGNVQGQLPRLTQAIQQAGGIKPLADIRRVEVRRYNRDGSQQVIPIDLWTLVEGGDISSDIILQEGDRVLIPTAAAISPKESETLATASFSPAKIRVKVVGEVKQPGVLEIPPNTPLNQAILTAGNFDPRRADSSVVELIRLNPDGTVTKRSISVDFSRGIDEERNPTLRDNDVVVVNRNALTSATDTIGTIVSPLGSALGLFNIFNIFR